MKKYLTIIGTLALAAGCQGEFNSGNNGINPVQPDAMVEVAPDAGAPPADLSGAESLYEANVRPIIIANCSPDGACHTSQTPAFVSADPNTAYNLIQGYKDSLFPGFESEGSLLLQYGQAHQSAAFSADDIIAIQSWLAVEKMEADANGPQYSALQLWSGCMNIDDWNEENVANEWANKNAQNQGDCDACHNLGADGFIASEDSARMFRVLTEIPALMPSYFTLNAAGTEVLINRSRLENVGNLLEPHQAHGAFQVDGNDNAMQALQRFYDKTKARQLLGNCDLPRY